ncbi:MAG: hypothetical protein FWE11_06080 [Defluviitaleaceae bacterium]|nr:hypothetical protein [Defluviitaleaceae bacterium]
MKKKHLLLFVALLVFIVSVPVVFAHEAPGNLDWNLSVAVSAGIEPDQLMYLTDDEVRLLHQPYVDIANSISAEFGVNIEIGTIDCYFMTRDDIIYTITNVSLAEIDLGLRELAEQVRNIEYSSRVLEAALDARCDYALAVFVSALNGGVIDPVYAYYSIQQNGISFLYGEIEPLFDSLNYEVYDAGFAVERMFPVYRFVRTPTEAQNILRNHIGAAFCHTTRNLLWTEVTPFLTPVSPWSFVSFGFHIETRVQGGVIISTDNGGTLRRVHPGGWTETTWWERPIITGFQAQDRSYRLW